MYFGKNIKKIRSIKKLSQAAFAELFGLKRSSIGAWEEGRAEPKLEIIIKIAKYFSISVDHLVNSEITVNELSRFDLFDKYINGDQKKEEDTYKSINIAKVALVSSREILLNSLEQVVTDSKNEISLPGLNENQAGILIDENTYKQLPIKIKTNDIIVVNTKYELSEDTNLANRHYLIKWSESIYIGEIKRINSEEYLFILPDSMPLVMHKKDIHFILPVEIHISNNPEICIPEPDRVGKLELLINDLYSRLK